MASQSIAAYVFFNHSCRKQEESREEREKSINVNSLEDSVNMPTTHAADGNVIVTKSSTHTDRQEFIGKTKDSEGFSP
jgi:hypothetical protein